MGIFAVLLAACSSSDGSPATGPDPVDTGSVRLEVVVSGLQGPVHVAAPAGDSRIFIVEQRGIVRILENGQLLATPFLDIRSNVGCCGERGLLSVAFHPAFATSGYFYVNYTGTGGSTRVERYRVSANPNVADAGSATLLLSVDQPFSNHNGGHILFGPDNLLYIAMGDGGSGGDPHGHGQNPSSRLGKLLRVNVDAPNPAPQIFALGLRNPWRIAFDRTAGLLYVADVGQNQWEEVNVVPAAQTGLNYGWNVMEGRHCYGAATCDQQGLTLPVLEYSHVEGCSITGGLVYRGSRVPSAMGHYFYADYCGGWIRSFRYADGQITDQRTWNFGNVGNITSFGEDGTGELYVVSAGGTLYRLTQQP